MSKHLSVNPVWSWFGVIYKHVRFLSKICHKIVLKSFGVFCCLSLFSSLLEVVEFALKKDKGKISLIVFMPNFSKKNIDICTNFWLLLWL